eukprot:4948457-Heterocapsa_arctica.AAC.1
MVHCLKLREFLDAGMLKVVWWIDTLDMLADGITEGSVDRTAILAVVEHCKWKLLGLAAVRWPKIT